MGAELADVIAWASRTGESKDVLSALTRIPLRLGEAAPALIPACLATIEAALARRVDAYAEVSRSRDLAGARRREDSRIRAAMGRYNMRDAEADPAREAVRATWVDLRDHMGRAGGEPGTTGPFDRWSHRTLAPLVARARKVPMAGSLQESGLRVRWTRTGDERSRAQLASSFRPGSFRAPSAWR